MKVILLRDVAKLGLRHSVVVVPDGFALNKLVPQGMALPATPENLKRVQNRTKEAADQVNKNADIVRLVLSNVEKEPLNIEAVANEQGHLFKQIHAEDIISSLSQRGFKLPASSITITEPIKQLGTHQIKIDHAGVAGTISVVIISK